MKTIVPIYFQNDWPSCGSDKSTGSLQLINTGVNIKREYAEAYLRVGI